MTDREKAIVMANTGITMLKGDKFNIFHEYIEQILGRPVWTHELGDEAVWNEIKEKSKDDFIEICRTEERWIPVSERLPNICGVYNVTKCIIDGGRRYYIADSCYFDGTDTWHDDNRINFGREPVNCIIAWQPLPEPYKKEIKE